MSVLSLRWGLGRPGRAFARTATSEAGGPHSEFAIRNSLFAVSSSSGPQSDRTAALPSLTLVRDSGNGHPYDAFGRPHVGPICLGPVGNWSP